MATVKRGYFYLTVPEQIERTRLIVSMMTGNASYPTPNPPLATVTGAVDALEVAYNESRNLDKIKMATMRERRSDLLLLVLLLSGYVQEASGGSEAVILSSGFFIRAQGNPTPNIAGEVTNLRLRLGAVSGRVFCNWDKANYAVNYVLETSPTADFANNTFVAITTRTQKELTGLTPGNTTWVRVRGLGRETAGDPCSGVSIRVN